MSFPRTKYGFSGCLGHEQAFFGKTRMQTPLDFDAKFDIF
jgi:hypothetical protein